MSSCAVDLISLRQQMVCPTTGSLWIFGYGSLIWRPGFSFYRRIVGQVRGYKRRFFQGTTTHRGTPEWPGRVATILADELSWVWGVAYQVRGPEAIDEALQHLAEREMITGGYRFAKVMFHSIDGEEFPIQVYIAEAANDQYLGDAPIPLQAYQILHARGVCGPNTEYVEKVVRFMRDEVPNGLTEDTYLTQLDLCMRQVSCGIVKLDDTTRSILPIQVTQPHEDQEWKRQIGARRNQLRQQSLSASECSEYRGDSQCALSHARVSRVYGVIVEKDRACSAVEQKQLLLQDELCSTFLN